MDSPAPGALPDDPPPAPPRGRHRLRWFWGIVAALALGAAAVVVFSDAPEPDLTDLAFEPVEVPDEENLYVQLVATARRFSANPLIDESERDEEAPPTEASDFGTSTPERPLLKERLRKGEGWTPERLAKYGPDLEQIASASNELEKLQRARGRFPESLSDIAPARDFRLLWQHLQLAVWARYRSGRADEAVDLTIHGARMGRVLRDARGTLIDYLIAVAMISSFEGTARDLASQPDMPAELLSRLLKASLDPDPFPDAYEHTLRNEFRMIHQAIQKHDVEEALADYDLNDWLKGIARTRLLFPLIYKPNLTTEMVAEGMRHEVKAVRASTAYEWHFSFRPPPQVEDQGIALFLRPINAHGRSIANMAAPALEQLGRTRYNSYSRRSLLQAYLALRLHHLETGSLPATLDELVPARLPALPRDFADGAPLRYSREARAVWSVGANPARPLTITQPDQEIAPSELFHRLDFAAPASAP